MKRGRARRKHLRNDIRCLSLYPLHPLYRLGKTFLSLDQNVMLTGSIFRKKINLQHIYVRIPRRVKLIIRLTTCNWATQEVGQRRADSQPISLTEERFLRCALCSMHRSFEKRDIDITTLRFNVFK